MQQHGNVFCYFSQLYDLPTAGVMWTTLAQLMSSATKKYMSTNVPRFLLGFLQTDFTFGKKMVLKNVLDE
jgi:hypothetical protein